MNEDPMITISSEDPGTPDARLLLEALSAVLEGVTGSSGKASFDAADVRGPRAVFAVARDGSGAPVGCGALRPLDADTAEIKRMYARRPGMGIGGRVLAYLEDRAREMGYAALRLETRRVNRSAVAFYERKGYRPIPNYGRYAGRDEAVCFEKILR